MKTLNTLILILFITTKSVVWAGGNNCDSLTTGNWSASSTWENCNGGIPQTDDFVTIKDGHVVTLDVNTNEINSLTVEDGGDFDVAFNAAGLTLFGSDFDGVHFDLSNASIDLAGDLTINAPSKNIILGAVKGAFGLTLNSSLETRLTGTIGGNESASESLTSLITDAGGTTVFAIPNVDINVRDISVTGVRQFNDPVLLAEQTNIGGNFGTIEFNNTVNSATSSAKSLYISAAQVTAISFNDDVGVSNPLAFFQLFNVASSTATLNLDQFVTTGAQAWGVNIVLDSTNHNISLTSLNSGNITLGLTDKTIRSETAGVEPLSINTAGQVTINATIGDNVQELSDFTLNSVSSAIINSSEITVTGTQSYICPITFGANSILSASIVDMQSTVDNGGFNFTIDTTDVTNMTGINGAISGSGDLIIQGVGDLTLAVNNSYTGATQIMAGTLILLDTTNSNPIASSSTIEIASAAILDPINISSFIIPTGQTLSGAGSVTANIAAAFGSFVSPGSNSSRGVLSSLSAEFNPESQLNITLDGTTAGTEHDQLSVIGNVGLSQNRGGAGAFLNISVDANLPAGGQFVIVEKDGINAISGVFDGLIEGANISAGNRNFSISYVGGDGNDIELTEISCQSVENGLWSESTTWINCDGPTPQATDNVNILHAVSFDVDATIQSLDFGASGDFDVAASGSGLTLNITAGDVDFTGVDIELFGDFTINNTNNKIDFGAIDGNFNLVINSGKRVWFRGDHTTNIGLKSIVTDAAGSLVISNRRTFKLSASADSIFNEKISIGPSAIVNFDHTGTGNLIFNNDISRFSGGPKTISITSDSGQSIFNGIVSLGEINTYGTANTVIAGGSMTTTSGGSSSGKMTFNGPVVVTNDTVFTGANNGTISFNNTLDDDGNGGTTSAVTINSPNVTKLSAVGIISPLDSLTTDVDGSSFLGGDIDTLISTTFNDPIVLINAVKLSGVIVDLKADVDNAGFDLTFDTNNNSGSTGIDGVLSGSGDFIKEGLGDMSFLSINTMTGNLILNSGSVINNNASNSIFPGVVDFSLAENTQAYLGGGGSSIDTFELIDGQVIKGEGQCQCILDVKSGASIAPGFSPGNLSLGGFKMATGATLAIELDGTIPSTDYDWISSSFMANFDADSSGGATLDVTLGYTPQIGDEFTIVNFGAGFTASGIFNGLPEGATFSVDGILFSITYIGSDGNDVVLTTLGSAIRYVDTNVAVAGDGSSWNNAFDNLHDALTMAVSGMEIWVAQGVYYPQDIILLPGLEAGSENTATFTLPQAVKLYGGFNATETLLEQRDTASNLTILSGDTDLNDVNNDNNFIAESTDDIQGFNVLHVLTAFHTDSSAVVDGFTITAGSAFGLDNITQEYGGGMYCYNFGPSINDVTFIGNKAFSLGGAMINCFDNISNSRFINNFSVKNGGAIGLIDLSSIPAFAGNSYSLIIENVSFEGNTANDSGGAIYSDNTALTLSRIGFKGNQAQNDGGAIYTNGLLDIDNSLFQSNLSSTGSGGAIFNNGNIGLTINNVTLSGNRSFVMGGAVTITDFNTPTSISNSILWNNQDSTGTTTLSSSIDVAALNFLVIQNSDVQGTGGSSNWNPAAGIDLGNNVDVNPVFHTIVDPANSPTTIGNTRARFASPVLNVGDNAAVTELFDLDGNDRIQDTIVDMGAYEGFDDVIFKNDFEL